MRLRSRYVLPLFGLALFGLETYGSIRTNRDLAARNQIRKEFIWGTFHLRTDPLGRIPSPACPANLPNCKEWLNIRDVIIDPAPLLEVFSVSALPALIFALWIVHGLGRFGINQVYSFFVATPILTSAWYYFVGWLFDLWRNRKKGKLTAVD